MGHDDEIKNMCGIYKTMEEGHLLVRETNKKTGYLKKVKKGLIFERKTDG